MTRIIIAAAFVLATFASAQAGYQCSYIGTMTYCTDDGGNQVTCTTIGNQTFCN